MWNGFSIPADPTAFGGFLVLFFGAFHPLNLGIFKMFKSFKTVRAPGDVSANDPCCALEPEHASATEEHASQHLPGHTHFFKTALIACRVPTWDHTSFNWRDLLG